MMVAGEASGDLLGGTLLADLRVRFPHLTVFGVGGSRMRAQGLQGIYDINDLSVVGVVEVVRCFPRLLRVFLHLARLLEAERPRLLVTVDLPDFNFMLAKRAKALGIPVVHYVGPQVWAWRRGRVERIARLLDHLLVLFPFEPEIYAHTTLPVTFVGHPLVEWVQRGGDASSEPGSRAFTRRTLGVGHGERLVVLLPGSRRGEVQRLLSIMVMACRRVAERMPNVRFALALADTLSVEEIQAHWPASGGVMPEIAIHQGRTHALLGAADATLVASGTATLEAALLGAPMVVVYRVNRVTYEMGRRLIQVPFISLANLVAGIGLVTERIQDDVSPEVLAGDLIHLLTDTDAVAAMRAGFDRIRAALSYPSCRAVDVVADFL